MTPDDDKRGENLARALGASALHPADVLILEAFSRIEQPLSTRDLALVLEDEVSLRGLVLRVRHLTKLGAIEPAETPATLRTGYRLDEAAVDDARSPIAVRFGHNLRACRRRAGITQEKLGFLASLHRTEVGLLERGHREPQLETIIKLASALSSPPERLLEGIAWGPKGFDIQRLGTEPTE